MKEIRIDAEWIENDEGYSLVTSTGILLVTLEGKQQKAGHSLFVLGRKRNKPEWLNIFANQKTFKNRYEALEWVEKVIGVKNV